MCTITTTEFKNNFGKYVALGSKEEIIVTKHNNVVFRIIPEIKKEDIDIERWFGIIPKDVNLDDYDKE